ncbi:hypothetical protein ACL7TT_01565 [Microbulbifer sp. 2304DJ12-6]|uniref:hypothetical protein n=1 Tax=Microbulbifer sp. 2304DJ12-6 TaxID=3233340 RepID=UPI0039AEB7D4
MNLFGACPKCKAKLSPRIKDKTQCTECGSVVQACEKQAMVCSVIIFLGMLISYSIDWRLLMGFLPMSFIIGLKTNKYEVVVDREN